MALLRALRSRAYAFLWAGQTVSSLGDWLYRIALVWWVLGKTGSGETVGAVAVMSVVPQIVLMLFGGVLVDRLPRTLVMIASDIARGLLTALLAALVFTDRLEVWLVYAVTFAFSFVDAFVGPAFTALVAEIVAADDRPSANSLSTLSSQLSGIGGPALGALMVEAGGTGLAFAVDSATFFVSAVCLLAIGRLPKPRPRAPTHATDFDDGGFDDGVKIQTVTFRVTGADFLKVEREISAPEADAKTNVFADMRAGLRTVRSEPWLWVTMLCASPALSVYAGLMSVSLPFMIKDTLHLDVGSLGIVQGASAVGAVIGAVWLGRRGRLRRRGPFLYLSVVVMGLALAGMGVAPTILAIAAAALICNGALNAMNLVWLESVQSTVPNHLIGRVWSIDSVAAIAPMPIAFFIAGWATDHAPPPVAFIVGGLGVAALALVGLLHPRIQRFD